MAGADQPEKPISLFYSYSHKDEELRNRLEEHLAVLRWNGLIREWHDRNIDLGEEWAREIDRNLASADIILLLVSASFLASKYCWSVEMEKALERHDHGDAKVVPVILRHCRWGGTPFAKLQAAPKDGKPVTSWRDQDEALDDVVTRIERVVAELLQRRRAMEEARQQAEAERERRAAAEERQEALQRQQQQDEAKTRVEAEARRIAEQVQRERLEQAAPQVFAASRFADFAVFRDGDAPWCPEMVALPAGEFLMGSPNTEEGRFGGEGPQQWVTIGRFALGWCPVTMGEYRRFVEASGHRHDGGMWVWTGSEWMHDASKSWRDPGFVQTDRHPVVGVSWRDATAYCGWLGVQTKERYRLPSEAEWEYACRAGTPTRYSFGDSITPENANYDESKIGKTVEVGAYPPNPWGLDDMHGNVWEWVEDIYHDSYKGAPSDGSAWTDGEGKQSSRARVVRGGSWYNVSRLLRSAHRSWYEPVIRLIVLGFRVARTLD